MQVFFFVMNRTEHLEHLLQEFDKNGIIGATVLDSKGMARILHSEEEMPLFYGLRSIVAPERRSSKTIFCVLNDEKVELARKIVNQVTKSHYATLLESGIKIYQYTPGFMHEKCVLCDD